jgi:hypothetical protein
MNMDIYKYSYRYFQGGRVVSKAKEAKERFINRAMLFIIGFSFLYLLAHVIWFLIRK